MKIAASISAMLLSFLLLPGYASADIRTLICIKNTTSERKLITVEDVDSFDWEGFDRPDHNWNGTYIEAGARRCEQAHVSSGSSWAFAFVIDGSSQSHKVRMSYREFRTAPRNNWLRWSVLLGDDPSWSPLRADQSSLYQGGWEAGGPCPGDRYCGEFNFKIVDVP